jgi:glutaminyl-peptide cyclotransferase
MRRLFTLLLALVAAPALAQVPIAPAQVVREYPHDNRAFTEGLFYLDGYLYESTGELGRSGLRKVDLATGHVVQQVAVNPPLYGEGIAPWHDQILSLTWRNGVGFRWSRAGFKRLGSFHYSGEGWALTSNGRDLIMSDGTDALRVVDPATFTTRRLIKVTADGQPVTQLNEVEWVDGEILANIWLTDRIARIDPATGHVIGWIDVSALHRRTGATDENDVPNGIAWDAQHRRLFVTGKDWPILFEIKPPKGR